MSNKPKHNTTPDRDASRNRTPTPDLRKWIWAAARTVLDVLDPLQCRDYVLPLVFLKRISDVFADEINRLAQSSGSVEAALVLAERDRTKVRFFLPPVARWESFCHDFDLGANLNRAMHTATAANPTLGDALYVTDYTARTAGRPTVSDSHLRHLVAVLGSYRLGSDDATPDSLGDAWDYLLGKVAESRGKHAATHYTPPEVGDLLVSLLAPRRGMSICDPCCGSGGLLIKCALRAATESRIRDEKHTPLPPPSLFGQDVHPSTCALASLNARIHDLTATIATGDTIHAPAFVENGESVRQFDVVVCDPVWGQPVHGGFLDQDRFSRFVWGLPPPNNTDWAWVQHAVASLNSTGRAAILLDTAAVSRGSNSKKANREREIRRRLVEHDLIESVILLPKNLFYNTTDAGIVLIANRSKKHTGEILLINATHQFHRGRPKNHLDGNNIQTVADVYHRWADVDELSTVITRQDAAQANYDLSPNIYVGKPTMPQIPEISQSLRQFRKDHPDPTKTAFLMMQFGSTKAHKSIVKAIRSALRPFGITAVRADGKEYHPDLWYNVLTYIEACAFGIAVLERLEQDAFNPNVSLEVGYMYGLRKPVCLLKDQTLRTLHTDLVGKLYRPFDPQHPEETIPSELSKWLKDKGIAKA